MQGFSSNRSPNLSVVALGASSESYYRARYYDSSVGRFLTEDPIGFSGGEDFYSYVYNDPTDFIDPVGLQSSNYDFKLRYKCNALGVCTRRHPRGGKRQASSKNQPCPLVTKDFDDFNRCFDDAFPNNLPGSWAKQTGEKNFDTHLPASINKQPEIPGVGLGDLINTAGEAAEHAFLECFKAHPLAALDPRFPPQLNVGKMSSPNWWDGVTGFLNWGSPVF